MPKAGHSRVASRVALRDFVTGDLEGVARVALATGQPEQGAGADPGYVAHVVSRGRLLVAVEENGEVVGFGASVAVGTVLQLTDLFVLPDRQGGGIGRRLLDAVLASWPVRRMTFSSRHPSAMPLYARAGLVPRWPLFYLAGPGRGEVRSGATIERVDPVRAAAAEQELTGVDRSADYRYWTERHGSAGVVIRAGDRLVAAGVLATGEITHLACPDRHQATAAVLAAAGQVHGEQVRLCLPGPHPALRPLLECGYLVVDYDLHMSTEPGLAPETGVLSPALV